MADNAKHQHHTNDGMRFFERVEKGLKRIADLAADIEKDGMVDICQSHALQNKALSLFFAVQALHCEFTHVAQSNECDVPSVPDDGDGGVVVQGGPGR